MTEVAVITGASAGIGRATAREFARQGCRVALVARGRRGLEATAREVEELGGEALVIPTDVADWEAVEHGADKVMREFGRIDVWVNNAFAGIFSRFMDMSLEEFRRVTDVTYYGQVHGTRAALKHMLPRNSGTIVLVGSALAYRGIPLQSAYCAAKHAVQGFQDSLRAELLAADSNVRLTMVQLAGGNIEAQQDPQPLRKGRKDNLLEPVDAEADRGAHGRFDDQSRTRSPLLWASENRAWLAAGAALALGAGSVTARMGGGEKK